MFADSSKEKLPIDSRIPVTIITGFLGAGKTTLLNHLIKEYPEKKFAVIENEFGEINIDSELVINTGNNIFELSNGCICCALNEDLATLLYELLESKNKFDHLLIETTGIADPGAVALNFISDFGIQQRYRLDSIVALIDALNLKTQLVETEEAAKQIAVSDVLLLNKSSSVEPKELEDVIESIKNINHTALIHLCDYSAPRGINILAIKAFSAKFVLATDFENYEPPTILKNGLEKKHIHSDINSVSITIKGKLNPIIFDNWITLLLFSSTLYRIKGVLNMDTFDKKYIFQAVGSQFVGELGPDWTNEERINKMVFIGKNLTKKILENGFAKCLIQNE
ncbi:MAG TPA: GTP-binding protein [Cytophagaceae bacterium]|jgi:G3E family GTPase|nr:GTP-binding protein [Cytophagaceae bacterium]